MKILESIIYIRLIGFYESFQVINLDFLEGFIDQSFIG